MYRYEMQIYDLQILVGLLVEIHLPVCLSLLELYGTECRRFIQQHANCGKGKLEIWLGMRNMKGHFLMFFKMILLIYSEKCSSALIVQLLYAI